MIDNFKIIRDLLKFDSTDDFYFVQVLQRKKDFKEENKRLGRANNARLIKAYYIKSLYDLDEHKDEIIALANMFNARVGINLNKRSMRFTSLMMLKQLADSIYSGNYYNPRLWNSVCGEYYPVADKTWILDIDEVGRNANELILFAERECLPEGNKYITTIPTKSGYHLIMKPFDSKKFGEKFPDIQIHKNNPVNLYIP